MRSILLAISVLALVSGRLAGQTPAEASLKEYRVQIDSIDRQIVELLNKRAVVVSRIGELKHKANLPVAAPAREKQVLDHVVEVGKSGPLPPEVLRRIYMGILDEMRTWEATISTPRNGSR